jgi:two-component system sensor histidine kinase BaeS
MALIALLTVALISYFSVSLIRREFKSYIARQQEERTLGIISSIGLQYRSESDAWNVDFVHAIGMAALNDGYIIKVLDDSGNNVWDAQAHDMSLCMKVMESISQRMGTKLPEIKGAFETHTYDIPSDGKTVGSLSVGYYEPFFLSENDFRFLDTLNAVILGIGVISLGISAIVGIFMAAGLSRPLRMTVDAAKQISGGNYKVRIKDDSNTVEIQALMQSINNLAGSLEQQEGIRKQLVEDVSHEIRTPIAILQTHMEAMIEGIWQPTTEHLQSCYDEAIRVGQLMNDIENLTTVNSVNLMLEKTEFAIKEIIQRVIKGFEVEIGKKNLMVSIVGQDMNILADMKRISQVIVNLISNAVKYSKDGSRIEVEILETEGFAVVSVKDDGIGITKEELPHVFERFYRADKSRNRKTGGSGIGLSIVKSIVEAHGGRVSAYSRVDEGSTFEIMLPK